jgi:hypothetical protein
MKLHNDISQLVEMQSKSWTTTYISFPSFKGKWNSELIFQPLWGKTSNRECTQQPWLPSKPQLSDRYAPVPSSSIHYEHNSPPAEIEPSGSIRAPPTSRSPPAASIKPKPRFKNTIITPNNIFGVKDRIFPHTSKAFSLSYPMYQVVLTSCVPPNPWSRGEGTRRRKKHSRAAED